MLNQLCIQYTYHGSVTPPLNLLSIAKKNRRHPFGSTLCSPGIAFCVLRYFLLQCISNCYNRPSSILPTSVCISTFRTFPFPCCTSLKKIMDKAPFLLTSLTIFTSLLMLLNYFSLLVTSYQLQNPKFSGAPCDIAHSHFILLEILIPLYIINY